MNKSELIAKVAEVSGLKKTDAEKAVNAFTQVVTDALVNEDKVQLVGFGTYEVKSRPARIGRNPSNGEKIEVAASKAPVFKAGKSLKDAVNK